MATLNLKILPNRRKSSGKLGIYISLTFKKEVRYISTNFEIDDIAEFEDGKVCYRRDATIMNKRLDFILNEYKSKLKRIDTKKFRTCSQLKEALTKSDEPESLSIKELFERRILRLEKEGRKSYASMNKYTLNVVTSVLGNPPIDFLTRQDIKKLSTAMRERGYAKGNEQMHMTRFKAAINEAIDDNFVKYEDHPFKGYTMPQSSPRQMDITVEEFQKIRNLKVSEYKLNLARNMFLLSFYLGGINLADLVKVDLKSPILKYERQKTAEHKRGERTTTLTIPEEARELIKWCYKFSVFKCKTETEYQNLRRYINKCLALLAEKVGIKTTFSFYSARKTFAQFAFMLGVKTEVIEYCIGQTMKTNRPIYNYVRVMQRQADACIRKVIDYTENPDAFELYDGF